MPKRILVLTAFLLYLFVVICFIRFGRSPQPEPPPPGVRLGSAPRAGTETKAGDSPVSLGTPAGGPAGAVAAGQAVQPDPRPAPYDYAAAPEDAEVVKRITPVGPRDYFQAIERPQHVPAPEASAFMSETEVVLGLHYRDQALAYPINYLNDHEIVREEIDGSPLLVTW